MFFSVVTKNSNRKILNRGLEQLGDLRGGQYKRGGWCFYSAIDTQMHTMSTLFVGLLLEYHA